jgi:hypothetical protein
MTVQRETVREECQRHAHECLDLVAHSTNTKTRDLRSYGGDLVEASTGNVEVAFTSLT